MAKFTIATPTGTSYTTAGDYGYEMEALTPIDAEIFEIRPGSEDEFVSAARDADALYAKGRRITKRMIDGLERCKIIALGSVGVAILYLAKTLSLARDRYPDHTVAGGSCQSPRTGAVGGGVKRNSDITIVMISSTERPAIIPAKRSSPGVGESGGP